MSQQKKNSIPLQDKVEMRIQPLQIAIVAKQSKIVKIILDYSIKANEVESVLQALKEKTVINFR